MTFISASNRVVFHDNPPSTQNHYIGSYATLWLSLALRGFKQITTTK